jgi:sulfite exporter TauE/SafE/copper chaperone CopZ
MSRRSSRARARTARTTSAPITTAEDETADDLHRRAFELREYRMGRGTRPVGTEVPRAVATSAGTMSVTLPVMGMTCRSCEVRIAKSVGQLPNVARVSASAVRGQVTVETSGPLSQAAIEKAINRAGYEIGRTAWLETDPTVWVTAGAGVLMVAVLAVIAQVTGLTELASGAGDLSSGGVLVALLLGLAAGVSTCMALVGGLVLGLSAAFQAGRASGLGAAAQMRPALVFVAGRIGGYALLGAALGAVGASVAMPPLVTAVLMISVALVMAVLGTRLTGLSPRIAGWSPTLPMGLGARLGLGGGPTGAYSDRRAAILGAASFFLPCGFTQAIQIYALSTGSPLFAAALLGTFAIGTAPGLLALAGLPIVVPSRARPALLRLVGVAVLGFAVLNGSAGLRLSGFTMPAFVGSANAAPLPGTLGADGVQSITTYQDADGYSPGNVVIYAGYPTRWTVQSSTTATCAASLWIPGLDIRARLTKGANTFELPAFRAGTLDYTCAMGMYSGRITVVEAPAEVTGAATDRPAATAEAPSPTAGPAGATDASPAPATTGPEAATPAVQELRTWQDVGGYGPADATIYAGIPTRWTIDSRSSATCAAFLIVPDLGIQRYLVEEDENVIELPPLEAGRLDYMCSMGMYWGSISIVDRPAGAPGTGG